MQLLLHNFQKHKTAPENNHGNRIDIFIRLAVSHFLCEIYQQFCTIVDFDNLKEGYEVEFNSSFAFCAYSSEVQTQFNLKIRSHLENY